MDEAIALHLRLCLYRLCICLYLYLYLYLCLCLECLCLCLYLRLYLRLPLCLRLRLYLYLYLHDGFFQESPRNLKLRLVQGWVRSTHFRNEGCDRTFVQPPTRLRHAAIECVDAFGQY